MRIRRREYLQSLHFFLNREGFLTLFRSIFFSFTTSKLYWVIVTKTLDYPIDFGTLNTNSKFHLSKINTFGDMMHSFPLSFPW